MSLRCGKNLIPESTSECLESMHFPAWDTCKQGNTECIHSVSVIWGQNTQPPPDFFIVALLDLLCCIKLTPWLPFITPTFFYMPKAIPSVFTQYLLFGVKIPIPHTIFLSLLYRTSCAISKSPHGLSASPPPFLYMPKAIPSVFAQYPLFGVKIQRPHPTF